MKNTVSKFFRVLCGIDKILIRVMSILVMLAIMAGITSIPVLAASNGIYIATATPHYKHPTTGKVEDAGGEESSVLGQSMTESATYKKALVEVDSAGNTYITVRLQLMDNIQNPQFQVDGKAVSASLMQEDYTNNTADYRMKVNSEKSIIRCNMYVIAMGREVVFYITVSNLQAGSGNFITSVKVEQPKQLDSVETQSPAQTEKGTDKKQTAQTELPAKTKKSVSKKKAAQTQPPAKTKKSADKKKAVQTQPPAKTKKSVGKKKAIQTEPPVKEAPVQAQSTTPDVPVQIDTGDTEPSATDSFEPIDSHTDEPGTTEPQTSVKDEDTALGLQEFDKDGNKVEQNSEDTKEDTKKSGGRAVVWWILGGIAVIAAAGGCVWYFCFFKKKK